MERRELRCDYEDGDVGLTAYARCRFVSVLRAIAEALRNDAERRSNLLTHFLTEIPVRRITESGLVNSLAIFERKFILGDRHSW